MPGSFESEKRIKLEGRTEGGIHIAIQSRC
jgi:hypothetical protein